MSTPWPKLEKSARVSLAASIAPTVMALSAEPGEVLAVSCCSGESERCVSRYIYISWSSTYSFVAGSDNGDNARGVEGLDGTVDGCRELATQGHVHDGLASDALLLSVVNDELHALENARVAATTIGIEDLDGDQVDLLGDAESSSTNGTSDVAAVTILIVILWTS